MDPFHSFNPATGESIWSGHSADRNEIYEAAARARKSLYSWANLEIGVRIRFLEKYAQLLLERESYICELISKETGKPLWESKNELLTVCNKVKLSIEAYLERCPSKEKVIPNGLLKTQFKPIGVLAVFGPFNFPLHLPNSHIIPALLAGNTILFKPSELTPGVGEALYTIWKECGLPEGVISIIQGGPDTGKILSSCTEIDGILFTGSFSTGKILAELYGSQPEKILALEMGGNNPLVIHKTTKLDLAALITLQSAYLTSGQRCTCARRLILTNEVDQSSFLQSFCEIVSKVKVGNYFDQPEPFMGPVINENQVKKLLLAQEQLIHQGGTPIIEMRPIKSGTGFISPGLIDVTNIKDRKDEEFFGPLLQLICVGNLDEAIEEANRTRYGLIASLISDSQEDFSNFYKKIRAGLINWNTATTGASSAAPFGGIGCSGNHRPSAYFAADYCSYPVASIETSQLSFPNPLPNGLDLQSLYKKS